MGKTILGLLLIVYIAVALANYSVVQSYLGCLAGDYFSKEWGAKVKIGSLHAMPFDHLLLDNILMVAPDGDTILDAETLRVRFKRFPYSDNKLELSSVYLRNAYYHFESYGHDINLNFIIDHYKKESPKKDGPSKPFTVKVNNVVLSHIHYKMDLPDQRETVFEEGVQIPHMEFYDIRAKIKNLTVVNDDVTCRIVRLSTTEASGFTVKDISGDVHVGHQDITTLNMEVETANSRILLDSRITYDDWDVMSDYLHTVDHDATIKPGTTVALSDVAYWAPVLWGINAQIEAEGHAYGKIDGLRAEGMSFHWGRESGLMVDGVVSGLPDMDKFRVDANVERLWTTAQDVESLGFVVNERCPSSTARFAVKIPRATLDEVEYVDMTAEVHGGIGGEATANVQVASKIGEIRADAKIAQQGKKHLFDVEANSDGLGLTGLRSDWLTHSGFALSVDGEFGDLKDISQIRANFDGALTNSVVRGNKLASTTLSGKMEEGLITATLASTDSLALLTADASANLADSLHNYQAYIDIQRLDLDRFFEKKGGNDEDRYLQSNIAFNLQGNTLEEMTGDIVAEYTQWGDLRLESLRIHAGEPGAENAGQKHFTLESDIADVVVKGRFLYSDLPLMVRYFCQQTLPAEFNPMEPVDSTAIASIADKTLSFRVKWIDEKNLLRAIAPNIGIAMNSRLEGIYNHREQLKLAMRSDSLRLGSVVLDNVGMSGRSAEEGYRIDIEAQDVLIGAIEVLDKVNVVMDCNASTTKMELIWGEEASASHGDIALRMQDHHISVEKPDLYIGKDPWQLRIGDMTIDNTSGLKLTGQDICLESSQQELKAQMSLAKQDNDFVELKMKHFKLNKICDILLQNSPLDIAGDIGGRFSIYGISSTPYLNANLTIDSCVVNKQELGELSVRSNWNAELNILNLQVGGEQLYANGWIGLGREDPDMNINASFMGMELAVLQPMMASFTNRFEGTLHGDIDLSGTLAHPIVMGEANVENGALHVDVTNVTYYFSDTVRFANNSLNLDNFKLRDQLGNDATIDGNILYRDFSNIGIDIQLSTDNILVLNQKSGEQFYGTLLASADGTVKGNLNRLNISVRARTNPGCTLTVPVSNQQEVRAQSYISFVNDDPIDTKRNSSRKTSTTNMNVELDLAITPDVQLNLPMDFSEVSATVGASGSGDLHMTIDGINTPQVLGNYEISSGTMKLGILSLIEKNFTIENGSSLNFQGSLPDARFDLRAIYSQRVNMSSLTGSLSSVDNTQKYIQVEDVIAISGTLQDPKLGFDIRLPNADQSVSEEVFAYIDRSSERDMLNQTMSLLLTGNFYNASGNGNGLLDNGLTSVASTVGNVVGNAVGNIVQFVDVDVDYKAATDLTNEQVDLNISKDWGRWYLESTLGYGGESRELQGTGTPTAIIDALIGYRLSPVIHLYGYNRTNTNDYTRIDLPYKQGAGLKLTKDFDRWSDLFKGNKQKKK